MINPIVRTSMYFDNKEKVVGYFDPVTSKYVKAEDVQGTLEMLCNHIISLTTRVNNLTEERDKK